METEELKFSTGHISAGHGIVVEWNNGNVVNYETVYINQFGEVLEIWAGNLNIFSGLKWDNYAIEFIGLEYFE